MESNEKKAKREKNLAAKELQKIWGNIDLPRFWKDVVKEVSKETEAYERARAKSLEGGTHQVLL